MCEKGVRVNMILIYYTTTIIIIISLVKIEYFSPNYV